MRQQQPEIAKALEMSYERERKEVVERAKEIEEKAGRLHIEEIEPVMPAGRATARQRSKVVCAYNCLLLIHVYTVTFFLYWFSLH